MVRRPRYGDIFLHAPAPQILPVPRLQSAREIMAAASDHIEITETLVRLYVFLAQTLDRCLDHSQQEAFPERDHQAFLTDTRAKLLSMVSVNVVVKAKVEEECRRVLELTERYMKAEGTKTALKEEVKAERAIFETKLIALSDLLAVFRAR